MFEIIAIACLSVLFVVAEPIILLKRQLGFKQELIDGKVPLRDFFTKLLYCSMCSGWWIGLAITHDIYTASIISILAELINRKL